MNNDDFILKYGKWAVVSGASDGIGKEICFDLARRGLNIVLVARREDVLKQVQKKIESEHGVETKAIPIDVSRPDKIKNLFDSVANLDIGLLVAAAGFGSSGEFINSNIDEEMNMIDVNCKAVIHMTHHFANVFSRQKRGGIILFSSLVAFQGTPYSANYSATKSFIQNFSEGIGVELKDRGVDVLAVALGPVKTGFGKRASMKMGNAPTAKDVVGEAVSALGRKTLVRPGFMSKFLEFALASLFFRKLRVQMMKKVMSGMTKHKTKK